MTYTRKTRDLFVVQGYYGAQYGWEDVHAEYSRAEARERLKEYRANEPQYAHRLVTKRERISQ